MRLSVLPAILASAVIGFMAVSCDLLKKDVLFEDVEKTVITDSTTVRVLASVPDSTHLIINTDAVWHADVAKGGDWCTISKHDGSKGRDTILIYVDENSSTEARKTSIVVESGTVTMVFRVFQDGGESWHDVPYWNRTAAQRMGLHGTVREIVVSDNRYTTEYSVYKFDDNGNLLEHQSVDKVANKYDTTRTYDYDDVNHRIRCTVKEDMGGTVVRKWRYEYANLGKLVAYSAKGWTDPDPLAEDMEGMVVPDLSAVFKTWFVGDEEFHENRTYTFVENDSRLMITTDRYKIAESMRIDMGRDTVRVSYQYSNSCGLFLPYSSRGNVTNSTYYPNGMLKLMRTTTSSYDFLDNSQRMAVVSYAYSGPQDAAHTIDFYDCEYNSNRDLTEKRIKYAGDEGVTVEKYPQYQYDEQHNWTTQVQELWRPGATQSLEMYTKREIIYYNK